MQSEWIIGFLILLIVVQLFMMMGISMDKTDKKSKVKKCIPCNNNKNNENNKYFKESYTTDTAALGRVFREIYENNINKYERLYKENVINTNLNDTLSQIVSAGEKIGKTKEDIKKDLEAKGVQNVQNLIILN